VTEPDIDPLSQGTIDDLVETTRTDLELALAAAHEQRSLNALVRALLRAILATLIVVRFIQYLRRFVRWSTHRLEAYATQRVERMKLPPAGITAQLIALLRLVVRAAGAGLALILLYSWLAFVLDQFPYTSPWGDQLGNYLQQTVLTVLLAIVRSVPGILMVIIIFSLTRLVSRWIRLLFIAIREGRFEVPGVDAETAMPTQRLIVILIWVLGLALAFPFIPGSGGPAFKGISVLFGLMVSLGASSVVGQAASGYILMYSRSLRVGDYVRIQDYEGTIASISMLSTKIRTPRDEEINVPNTVIVNNITKNYSCLAKESGVVMATTVTIGYSTPWRQIHAMLTEAAGRTARLRTELPPRVLQETLSDFYVEYTLLVRLERPDERPLVASELHANIQDVFNEHGVQIMSPHYENDPAGKVWVPKERWHEPPAERGDV
jgi:small-conductance mechanosensitive channel